MYKKMKKNSKYNIDDDIIKEIRTLLNHISLISRKCKENNVYLSAGIDPYKPLTDEEQQGPLVTKLFELTKNLRIILNRR